MPTSCLHKSATIVRSEQLAPVIIVQGVLLSTLTGARFFATINTSKFLAGFIDSL